MPLATVALRAAPTLKPFGEKSAVSPLPVDIKRLKNDKILGTPQADSTRQKSLLGPTGKQRAEKILKQWAKTSWSQRNDFINNRVDASVLKHASSAQKSAMLKALMAGPTGAADEKSMGRILKSINSADEMKVVLKQAGGVDAVFAELEDDQTKAVIKHFAARGAPGRRVIAAIAGQADNAGALPGALLIDHKGRGNISKTRLAGGDLGLSTKGNIELYKRFITEMALDNLKANRQVIGKTETVLKEALAKGDKTPFNNLRGFIQQDQKLAKRQKAISDRAAVIMRKETIAYYKKKKPMDLAAKFLRAAIFPSTISLVMKGDPGLTKHLNMHLGPLNKKFESVDNARKALRLGNPALKVLDTSKLDLKSTSDKDLFKGIVSKFDEYKTHIDKSIEGLRTGDIPIEKMDAVISQVNKRLNITAAGLKAGDKLSVDAKQWLKSEHNKELAINIGGGLGVVLLSVGAFFVSGPIGTGAVLGAGFAGGVGLSVYNFERADDLRSLGMTQIDPDKPLLNDPEAAKASYRWAIADLVLAGIPFSKAAQLAAKAARGVKALRHLKVGGGLIKQIEAAEQAVAKGMSRASQVKLDAYILSLRNGDPQTAAVLWKSLQADKNIPAAQLAKLKTVLNDKLGGGLSNILKETQRANVELIASLRKAHPDLRLKEIAEMAKHRLKIPPVPHGFTAAEFKQAQTLISDFLRSKGIANPQGFATGSRVLGTTFNFKAKADQFGKVITDFSKRDLDIRLVITKKMSKAEIKQLHRELKQKFKETFKRPLDISQVSSAKELEFVPVYGKIDLSL